MDETSDGSGPVTRVDSVTATGNDLTDNNTCASAAGKIGNAASFITANSESLTRTSNASLQTGDIDFTIAGWAWLDSLTPNDEGIVEKWDTAGQREYALVIETSRFRFYWSPDGTAISSREATTFGNLSISTWYFFECFHDATANTINIRINNGTADSVADGGGLVAGTSIFQIGRDGANFLAGRVDELGFWKRLLTTGERAALYNGGTGLTYPF